MHPASFSNGVTCGFIAKPATSHGINGAQQAAGPFQGIHIYPKRDARTQLESGVQQTLWKGMLWCDVQSVSVLWP